MEGLDRVQLALVLKRPEEDQLWSNGPGSFHRGCIFRFVFRGKIALIFVLAALVEGRELSLFDDLTNVVFLNLPRKNYTIKKKHIFTPWANSHPAGQL